MISESVSEPLRTFLWSIAICIWIYWLWSRREFYKFSLNFHTVWGVPILGALPYMPGGVKDFLPVIGSYFSTGRETIFTWVGVYPFLFTEDPNTIEQILTSPDLLNKAKPVYKPLAELLTNGLITSSADIWHHHRRIINPTFNHKVLLSFLGIFEKVKRSFIKDFETLDDGREHAIFDMIQNKAISLSLETTMGTQVDLEEIEENVVADKLKYLLGTVANHILFSFFHLGWVYRLNLKYRKLAKELHLYNKMVLDTKLSEDFNKSSDSQVEDECLDSGSSIKKNNNIFIDHAIEFYKKGQFSYNDVLVESNTMVAAAFETTTNAISSTILMLAMHPLVQEHLYEEICSVFPDKDFKLEYEHMEQLPYFDMVFNEVLRLVPPIPVIGRMPIKPTRISQNITLPKNLQILISIFHLHRRKDIWGPNADKFDPDHFLPDNVAARHPYAFIPFSKGNRNCIGWRYALFSTKIALTGIVRNFRFSTKFKFEDLQFVDNITMKYYVEPKIKIEKR